MERNPRAKKLRARATDAERHLWSRLRGRQLDGYKFRRQHPVGRYIVDFLCVEAALAVEVDGGQHQRREDVDLARTRFLQARGLEVIRFWNHDALKHTDEVLEVIRSRLQPIPRPRRGTRTRDEPDG
jgi:very-short-patch-repair endonuclease